MSERIPKEIDKALKLALKMKQLTIQAKEIGERSDKIVEQFKAESAKLSPAALKVLMELAWGKDEVKAQIDKQMKARGLMK